MVKSAETSDIFPYEQKEYWRSSLGQYAVVDKAMLTGIRRKWKILHVS